MFEGNQYTGRPIIEEHRGWCFEELCQPVFKLQAQRTMICDMSGGPNSGHIFIDLIEVRQQRLADEEGLRDALLVDGRDRIHDFSPAY
ncbi:hypothetical protein D3C72_1867350 [compost metagenome]